LGHQLAQTARGTGGAAPYRHLEEIKDTLCGNDLRTFRADHSAHAFQWQHGSAGAASSARARASFSRKDIGSGFCPGRPGSWARKTISVSAATTRISRNIVPDGMSFDAFAESTQFETIIKILRALSTQDGRIVETLR
jgi:hypothetical protein